MEPLYISMSPRLLISLLPVNTVYRPLSVLFFCETNKYRAYCYLFLASTKVTGLLGTQTFTAPAVTFPGSQTRGHACKQSIFRSRNNLLSMPCVLMKILPHASVKKKTKGLRVSNVVLLLVVFK